MSNALAQATDSVLGILQPLSPEERRKVVQAAFVLLGDDAPSLAYSGKHKGGGAQDGSGDDSELKPQAKAWMQKNGVTMSSLELFLHVDNSEANAIELPVTDKSAGKRTTAAYLMAGLVALLKTGDPSFADDAARALCTHFGCYDKTNHSKHVKGLGNKVTGSKTGGWKLTAPGLTAIAGLIKDKAPASA